MTTEDSTRFEVLLEDVLTKVKVIAEGHCALLERLDPLGMRVDRLESRGDQLEIHVAVLDKKVGAMDRRLERMAAHLRLAGAPPEGGA